jgi:mRNA-degrading endonuclease RelE of RelBE toxin-antitoxin system
MRCRILVTRNFAREFKKLSKKYYSLRQDLGLLEKELMLNPRLGTPLGGGAHKIRLAVKSKKKGKSGGLRVITYVELNLFVSDQTDIFLLSIYDKSETENISREEILRLVRLK